MKNLYQCKKNKNYLTRKQSGTSLLEVLVSIVLMAIGLLGLASMQVNALQFQKTAGQRAEATQAAFDLGERMRANWLYTTPEQYAAEKVQNEAKYKISGNYSTTASATHTPPYDCLSSICATDKVAKNDVENWLNSLQRRLVGGAGYAVPVTGTSGSAFDVTIMWQEQGFSGVDATCPSAVAAPAGVRCFNIRVAI